MVAVIADGDESQLETLADDAAKVVIFIVARIDTRTVNRVARLAIAKLSEGGRLVVADSLPAALERL